MASARFSINSQWQPKLFSTSNVARERVADDTSAFADPFWCAAADAALGAAEYADYVLVPAEFLPLHPRFAPLEYAWGLEDCTRIAWCCSKDDVDRLAPWLHSSAANLACCSWANEVFVLGGNFAWSTKANADSRRHLVAWWERLDRYRSGIPARDAAERWAHADSAGARPTDPNRRVLIVGASGMGNVGDDLIAQVLASMAHEVGADAYLSGPDIDPLRIRAYSAVIVGGGGLVYASRDGSIETQNLANYLKFGPIGRHFGVPTAMLGVSDQDHARGIERDDLSRKFSAAALAQFDLITTRDAESTAYIDSLGASAPQTGSDLLFDWMDRARRAVRPSVVQPGRIAFAGEFYRYAAFADGIGDGDGPLAAQVREGDFDVLIMSNDDVHHAQRLQQALQRAGAAAALVDLRDRDLEALVFLFASYRALLTTRFHGLVLAAMVGVPVVALDCADGKKARLLRELDVPGSLLLDDAGPHGIERLEHALSGKLEPLPIERAQALAEHTGIHRAQLRSLLSMDSSAESGGRADRASVCGGAVTELSANREGPADALFDSAAPVGLCWAASCAETDGFANLGDSLSAVIVAGLAGRPVKHLGFDAPRTKLVAVGSIGHAIKHDLAVLWGAGVSIRGGVLAQNVRSTRYDIRAIRGPISAQHFRDFGITVPDIYGDPVWLLPTIVDEPVEKKYELGIVPHIQDVRHHHPDAPARSDSLRCRIDLADARAGGIALINTWHEPTWEGLLAKLRLIRSCKRILSQSFHGVVIAEAYGIPVLNFRHLPGADDGLLKVDLTEPCNTDPRIWEFYKGGPRPHFYMYSQRRDQQTDWDTAIRAIDERWEPFEYDASKLVEAFPLRLAYNPLREHVGSTEQIEALKF